MIRISAVLSIHNRSTLFRRALDGYVWQTMDPKEWEIILLDDMSTEDLSETYKHLIGKINIRHVMVDHTRHPIWKARNPNGVTKDNFENWFHTPAITINMGCAMARGNTICLCHPEILHAPWNFKNVDKRMSKDPAFLFGKTWLGTPKMNAHLNKVASWSSNGWGNFINTCKKIENLGAFGPTELYWYTSFIPKLAVEVVGGVDFDYLNGVAGEDDDFRDRVKLSGCLPVYFQDAEGFHQDHSNEQEQHRRRDTKVWQDALAVNRKLYFGRKDSGVYPAPANQKYNWAASECLVSEKQYLIDG